MSTNTSSTPASNGSTTTTTTTNSPKNMNGKKLNLFSHIKYEHMVAGISGIFLSLPTLFFFYIMFFFFFSGGVTSTLILHPLDLIKIRFAGKSHFFTYFYCALITIMYDDEKKHTDNDFVSVISYNLIFFESEV